MYTGGDEYSRKRDAKKQRKKRKEQEKERLRIDAIIEGKADDTIVFDPKDKNMML